MGQCTAELGPSAHAARKRPCRLCQVLLVQDRAAHAHPMAQLAFVVCDERDVLERRGPGHERAILQDHAHGWIVRAVMDNRARIRAFDARDYAQQGGLARSRRRHHAQARACRNMQVGVAQERARGICAVVAGESLNDEAAGGWHAL